MMTTTDDTHATTTAPTTTTTTTTTTITNNYYYKSLDCSDTVTTVAETLRRIYAVIVMDNGTLWANVL